MKTEYKESDYTERIRVKTARLEYIRSIKGKKSMAGKLDEIIEFYKEKHGNRQLQSKTAGIANTES